MNAAEKKTEVLVIDDESQIRRLLRFTLEDAGYAVREAGSGHDGLVVAAHEHPDVVILDLGLPDIPGVEVLQRLREWTATPVLILSVFGQEGSKIAALDAGADDYLTKPFGGGELLARLRALLRRARTADPESLVRFGSVEIDLVKRSVAKHGEPVKLTAREYALLRLLAINAGKVLTHGQILEEIWGPKSGGQTHYLRVFMMRLRRKIEDDPDAPRYLQTESGIGYRLVAD
jgi:two-component system KDP operon response regulator KdpE